MMYPVIDDPAMCESQTVIISFSCAKKISTLEVHCEMCTVYGQNVMIQ